MSDGYSIQLARREDLPLLEEIERAAAQLFVGRGVPESVINETTAQDDFRQSQARGRLWVALSRDIPWNAPLYSDLGFRELTAEQLSPALEALRREEAARGLDPDRRIAMQFETGPDTEQVA